MSGQNPIHHLIEGWSCQVLVLIGDGGMGWVRVINSGALTGADVLCTAEVKRPEHASVVPTISGRVYLYLCRCAVHPH